MILNMCGKKLKCNILDKTIFLYIYKQRVISTKVRIVVSFSVENGSGN